MTFGFSEQGRGSDSKGFGNPGQTENRDIPLSSFQTPNVGPVEVGLSRKFFLAPAEFFTGSPDCTTQSHGKWSLLHAGTLGS